MGTRVRHAVRKCTPVRPLVQNAREESKFLLPSTYLDYYWKLSTPALSSVDSGSVCIVQNARFDADVRSNNMLTSCSDYNPGGAGKENRAGEVSMHCAHKAPPSLLHHHLCFKGCPSPFFKKMSAALSSRAFCPRLRGCECGGRIHTYSVVTMRLSGMFLAGAEK